VELGEVIKLPSRKLQAASTELQAAWDKPLTTEYTTNKQNNVKLYYFKKHKTQASSSKRRAAGYRLWK
jgi:hypothetical protein